jgi:hypothetical protein
MSGARRKQTRDQLCIVGKKNAGQSAEPHDINVPQGLEVGRKIGELRLRLRLAAVHGVVMSFVKR